MARTPFNIFGPAHAVGSLEWHTIALESARLITVCRTLVVPFLAGAALGWSWRAASLAGERDSVGRVRAAIRHLPRLGASRRIAPG